MTDDSLPDNHPHAVPAQWPQVDDDVFANAKAAVLVALDSTAVDAATERMTKYYDPDGLYAASTFIDARPVDPWSITASDLFAVSLLSVNIDARSSRRFLEYGSHRGEVTRALRAIPVDASLDVADDVLLTKMEQLYRTVKATLAPPSKEASSNKWVTASKLCARKRPELFPVRDSVVCEVLGISHLGDFRADWQVFRSVIQDPDIRALLDNVTQQINTSGNKIQLDSSRLRVLDVALWTYGVWSHGEVAVETGDG